MVNFKFDPLRKYTNTPATPFQHSWLILVEYGEGIYPETEEEYKTLIKRSFSVLEEFLDIKHISLIEILEKMSLTLNVRTILRSRDKVDLPKEEYKSRQIGNHLRLEPLIKLADENQRRNNEAPTKEITTLFQLASLLTKLAPSKIQSQKDQIQYLKL